MEEVSAACDRLEEQGYAVEQYSFPTVKPIDKEVIAECAAKFEHIFTVEEHNIIGGFGSAVAEVVVQNCPVPMEFIGVNDTFGESGKPSDLMVKYKLVI